MFWGDYYLSASFPPATLDPLTSRDIDFYERETTRIHEYIANLRNVCTKMGLQMGDPFFPTMDDATFETAMISISTQTDNPIVIDFLDCVSGLKHHEVEKNADQIEVEGRKFWVLNPCYCLKARVYNLVTLYPRLGKSEERIAIEAQRVALGIEIVRKHLSDFIAKGEMRNAHKRSMAIIKLAKTPIGRTLYRKYGLDVLSAIPDAGLDQRFYQYVRPDAVRYLHKGDPRNPPPSPTL